MGFYSKTKSLARVFIVFSLILGGGFLGLWWLGKKDNPIVIKNPKAEFESEKPNALGQDIFLKFGGKTPLDTVKLFVSALEKGDLALASKYLSPLIREEQSRELNKLQELGYIDQMVAILKNAPPGEMVDVTHWKIGIGKEEDEDFVEVDLEKNEAGLWKITAL